MLCFLVSAFSFPFQMAPSGRRGLTSCAHSEGLVAPGEAFCPSPEKHVFLERSFSAFFLDLLANMVPKCDLMCCFGTSRATPRCIFLVFSPTLFLNETIMCYYILVTFTNVCRARKMKRQSSETLTALATAQCQENTPRHHNWERK